jgi:hypothetical protein
VHVFHGLNKGLNCVCARVSRVCIFHIDLLTRTLEHKLVRGRPRSRLEGRGAVARAEQRLPTGALEWLHFPPINLGRRHWLRGWVARVESELDPVMHHARHEDPVPLALFAHHRVAVDFDDVAVAVVRHHEVVSPQHARRGTRLSRAASHGIEPTPRLR